MIIISKITDCVERAVARLASQFKNALKLNGLISALADEAQALEDALWDLYAANRDVAVATGTNLDRLGDLVGAPVRGPRTDAEYRLRIAAQIIINRSSGESGSIYLIAKKLVEAWDVADQPRVRETGPAQYTIGCDGESFALPTPTASFGSQLTTGGVIHFGTLVAYRVSALSSTGETLASTEIVRSITGITNTNRQTVTWPAIPGASSYKIYGRSIGSEQLISTVAASVYPGTISYIDTGTATPSGALPGAATATFSNDTTLVNDTTQARELANVLADSSSAGVRSIVRSRSDAPPFFPDLDPSTDDHDYAVGDRVFSGTRAYECVEAGHSGAIDIEGTGHDIPDPVRGTPHWKFIGSTSKPGFFRFAGGTGPSCGFGVGCFIGAYDR